MNKISKMVAAAMVVGMASVVGQASLTTKASLGDYVWYDLDENGVQNEGPGAAAEGVTVNLYRVIDGAFIGTRVTDAAGWYLFEELLGDLFYVVEFVPPVGYGFTVAGSGLDRSVDSDAGQDGRTAQIFVPWGWDELRVDAGLVETAPPAELLPAELGNYVWFDSNRNGVQDAGFEWGVEGVTVNLFAAGTLDPVAKRVTDADGYYLFPDLVPGTVYTVQFVLPSGYTFTAANQGADNEVDSDAGLNGLTTPIVLVSEQKDYSWDAGIYLPASPGTGTPGYWKNHPNAWPVDVIVIGSVTYTKAQAIALMKASTNRNKWLNMFEQLVSATLNAYIGNNTSCISDTIAAANSWVITTPTNVTASSAAWQPTGSALHTALDNYNNGRLCAPHRN